jgi:hypothetical protein
MKQNVTKRTANLLASSIVAVALACSDSSTNEPFRRTSDAGTSAGVSADTATHGGGPVGSPHDSGGAGNPAPSPKPVNSFTLVVHAGTPRVGATDTLLTNPLAGATVSVTQRGYVVSPGGGQDTLTFTETLIATATTDANGEVRFPNLKGAATYVVKALPPAGLALSAPTAIIPNAYSETITTTLVFRKP